jgi:hypothetical protein
VIFRFSFRNDDKTDLSLSMIYTISGIK